MNAEASPAPASRADVCEQVGRAVSSMWHRRFGARPASVDTEYVGDVVRCAIQPGEPDEDAGDSQDEASSGVDDARAYQQEARTAIERLTGRKVSAFVAKRGDARATEAFILESVRVKH